MGLTFYVACCRCMPVSVTVLIFGIIRCLFVIVIVEWYLDVATTDMHLQCFDVVAIDCNRRNWLQKLTHVPLAILLVKICRAVGTAATPHPISWIMQIYCNGVRSATGGTPKRQHFWREIVYVSLLNYLSCTSVTIFFHYTSNVLWSIMLYNTALSSKRVTIRDMVKLTAIKRWHILHRLAMPLIHYMIAYPIVLRLQMLSILVINWTNFVQIVDWFRIK